MKHLAAIFLLLAAAVAQGQTVKSLGYNTANGEVVANTGTNVLTFTNALKATSYQGTTTELDKFIVSKNGIEGFFAFETKNTNDGNIGLYIFNDDLSLFGAVLLGVRGGDAFIQSQTTNVRVETVGGNLANLVANSLVVTNAPLTRTNLFGHGGISTNFVVGTNTLVFTNGILREIQ